MINVSKILANKVAGDKVRVELQGDTAGEVSDLKLEITTDLAAAVLSMGFNAECIEGGKIELQNDGHTCVMVFELRKGVLDG